MQTHESAVLEYLSWILWPVNGTVFHELRFLEISISCVKKELELRRTIHHLKKKKKNRDGKKE